MLGALVATSIGLALLMLTGTASTSGPPSFRDCKGVNWIQECDRLSRRSAYYMSERIRSEGARARVVRVTGTPRGYGFAVFREEANTCP